MKNYYVPLMMLCLSLGSVTATGFIPINYHIFLNLNQPKNKLNMDSKTDKYIYLDKKESINTLKAIEQGASPKEIEGLLIQDACKKINSLDSLEDNVLAIGVDEFIHAKRDNVLCPLNFARVIQSNEYKVMRLKDEKAFDNLNSGGKNDSKKYINLASLSYTLPSDKGYIVKRCRNTISSKNDVIANMKIHFDNTIKKATSWLYVAKLVSLGFLLAVFVIAVLEYFFGFITGKMMKDDNYDDYDDYDY